jgi:hypothetical protein
MQNRVLERAMLHPKIAMPGLSYQSTDSDKWKSPEGFAFYHHTQKECLF